MSTGPYRNAELRLPDPDEARARDAIQPELTAGERLVWAGRARRGLVFEWTDLFLIPFGLFWTAFSVLWETLAIWGRAPWYFCAFGIPFILVGLNMVAGRFLVDARRRARTFYGVTDRRVITVEQRKKRRVTSIAIVSLSEVTFEEGKGDVGTIYLGPKAFHDVRSDGTPVGPPPVLSKVKNARVAYDAIKDARDALIYGTARIATAMPADADTPDTSEERAARLEGRS